ncbi:MyoD family inhibitor domain containing protein [Dissostichus eleginoides]|uniref:MyoD family inhibitor domain containing protein n=1 Tax=Dissostichus eleginoides TaxID=100907 RepID=A0AAD9CD20_DISEL|nr:MyoD family inhibitor domain containing protein [Dissostichus eleginoides]
MDVTSLRRGSDITEGGANKNAVQSECISSQPTANGTLPHHNTDPLPAEAPPPLSDRSEEGESGDDSVTDSSSTKDIAPCCPHSSPLQSENRKRSPEKTAVLTACWRLFCEMLSMCSALGECLACGGDGASCCCDVSIGCCCCVEAAGEAACSEDACQAALDCGIMEDCCGSSDCLEICLECCSICFPS